MLRILFRYTSIDLLKVFIVTAVVLVVVVAFGSLIKPLATNLLGATSALQYALMATIPVLEYAIPFATGFACTLATHRMAVDNEITALSAAGLPMRRILFPQVAVGTACGLLLFALVNSAVPEVENTMREMLAREAGRVALAQLRDGESVAAGNVVIHADRAMALDVPASTDPAALVPLDRLLLEGVAAFETDNAGQPLTEFVAERAVVDLYEVPARGKRAAFTALKLRLENAVLIRPLDGNVARVPSVEPGAFVMGAVGPRPTQFLSGVDLWSAIDDPGQTAQALLARERLIMELADAEALIGVKEALARDGSMRLHDPATGRSYELSGAQLDGRALRPAGAAGRLTVTERQGSDIIRTATMRSASLERSRGEWLDLEGGAWVAMDLVAEDARATSAQGGAPLRWPHRMEGLRSAVPIGSMTSDDAALRQRLDAARAHSGPWGATIDRLASAWEQAGTLVRRHATAYVSLRLHAAVLVPIAALLGAVAAVQLKRATPLAVYIVAFVPTLVAVILAAQGKELLRSGDLVLGASVMWSGSVGMLGAALIMLWKVGRP